MDFGLRVAELQKEMGLTNIALAKRMGVSATQIGRWRNKRDVKLSVALAIAEALGVSIVDLCAPGAGSGIDN